MHPLFSLISIDKTKQQATYIQLTDQLITLIRAGKLLSGQRLLSSRDMAGLLSLHRKTVVRAYDELAAQGWIQSHTGRGTFVAANLPEILPQRICKNVNQPTDPAKVAGFAFSQPNHLFRKVIKNNAVFHLDDGFPDPRIAPLGEISRAYRSQLLLGDTYLKLGYGDTQGTSWLRKELSDYLNETRGFHVTSENILVTRGTMMGLHLVSSTLIEKGDHVALTEMSWSGATMNFTAAGAHLHFLPVDEQGIDLDALENLCIKKSLRLLYITSHHQYPSTVVLKAERRLRLISLSEKYGFIIFEDDYDYDFHYESKPLLPLAGTDQTGMVLYCGSFTKAISPAFRVGYLIGSENVIQHLARYRRIIDRQGDTMLENAMAELLQNGVIQRHLRKSLRIYRERRDVFCSLLKTHLSDIVHFQIPEGGLAVWTQFDKKINLPRLAQSALTKNLYFSEGAGPHHSPFLTNGTRLGFASSTPSELEQCVRIMSALIRQTNY